MSNYCLFEQTAMYDFFNLMWDELCWPCIHFYHAIFWNVLVHTKFMKNNALFLYEFDTKILVFAKTAVKTCCYSLNWNMVQAFKIHRIPCRVLFAYMSTSITLHHMSLHHLKVGGPTCIFFEVQENLSRTHLSSYEIRDEY